MNMSIVFAGSLIVASMVLQGCVSSIEKEEKKLESEIEAEASCMGGNFSCNGDWKSWCSKQAKKCAAKGSPALSSCTPKCTWGCESKKCDQTCAPKCSPAICSTRCKGFNTQSCQMKCDQPNCKVVCPKHFCPGKDCAACKTECAKPACKMQCKGDDQPCHHVCAQPKCAWVCKEPKECPKPKCSMKCEKPRNCLDNSRMVTQLPPLEKGETEVVAFHSDRHPAAGAPSPAGAAAPAPATLLQSIHDKSSTMRVDITTMGKDLSLQRGQVDLPVAPMDVMATALPSWTRTVKKQGGHVTESEASCDGGNFKCQGDRAWCEEQKDIVCADAAQPQAVEGAAEDSLQSTESVQMVAPEDIQDADAEKFADEVSSAFVQQRSGKQAHLRA